ncbi:MAG TPA: hypothetical protein VH351_22995 [Bryobacteraceae bacterium]|nr:hypothetical protein [Bryobacteraceae bacterium]
MSELKIRLDPLNPGQVYACCGLAELAACHNPGVLSRFESTPGRPRLSSFYLHGVPATFLADTLSELRNQAKSLTFDNNVEPGVSPVTVSFADRRLTFDWWLDQFRDKAVPLKCWAGQVTTRKLFEELLGLLDNSSTGSDLFEKSQLTKSKFGVDPRAAWNARDYGYSPNEHGKDSATFIAVEVLAAIGLQTFRPEVKKRIAHYCLWHCDLPLCLARTASVSPWDGLLHRKLQFSIASRGQSYKYFKFSERPKSTSSKGEKT